MAAVYASAAEYAERTGAVALSEAQHVQVTALLAEASALMRAAAVDLDDRLAAGTLERIVVAGVCVRVVHRYLANPTGASQLTSGPFSSSWSAESARGLWLTTDDVAALVPAAPVGTVSGVGTIRVALPVRPGRGEPRRWWT